MMYRICILFLLASTSIPLLAATHIVPGNYATIGDAYNAASHGDTILVLPGVYSGVGWTRLMFLGKCVKVISARGAANTIIDGRGMDEGFCFQQLNDDSMVVDGFTFIDCGAELTGAINFVEDAPGAFRNCIVTRGFASSENTSQAGEGGGIRIWGSSPVIEDCIIEDCSALQGGGFYLLVGSNPIIRRCIVRRNFGSGFQIAANCDPIIEDCLITDNEGSTVSWSSGIGCYENSLGTIRRCVIMRNFSDHATGGLHISASNTLVENCIIALNESGEHGGGIMVRESSPRFYFCTIADNTSEKGSPGVITTVNAQPSFYGCIIWNPTGPQIYYENGGTAIAEYCNIFDSFPGEGNFTAEPGFSETGDYHLTAESLCLDRGKDYEYQTDIDGEVRHWGALSDVGADEYAPEPEIFCTIDMPSHNFHPGDSCYVNVILDNTGLPRHNMTLFVALEAFGSFYFWPEWDAYSYQMVDLQSDSYPLSIIHSFNWPNGVGSAEGLFFHCLLLNCLKSTVYGNLSSFEFGWSEI